MGKILHFQQLDAWKEAHKQARFVGVCDYERLS